MIVNTTKRFIGVMSSAKVLCQSMGHGALGPLGRMITDDMTGWPPGWMAIELRWTREPEPPSLTREGFRAEGRHGRDETLEHSR